uniref:Uncharacterized protein n=1 Tax=Anguilla anguilla TaxID=7936 RepID=A0A0E9SBL4_ANGAN
MHNCAPLEREYKNMDITMIFILFSSVLLYIPALLHCHD